MGNQHKNQSFNIQEASKNNLLGEKLAKVQIPADRCDHSANIGVSVPV